MRRLHELQDKIERDESIDLSLEAKKYAEENNITPTPGLTPGLEGRKSSFETFHELTESFIYMTISN